MSPQISLCTQQDYNQILDELGDFWGGRDTRDLHHPMLVKEFGNSAFVIRDGATVIAYLFGFVSRIEPVGYVHLIAVRASARRRRLCRQLFRHFVEFARQHGRRRVKAITTPSNFYSIAFHKSLGMRECSSWANQILTDFLSYGIMRAVTNRALSFGSRFDSPVNSSNAPAWNVSVGQLAAFPQLVQSPSKLFCRWGH